VSDVTAHVPQEELGIQIGLAELTDPAHPHAPSASTIGRGAMDCKYQLFLARRT
jgi:hypothetical protein